jgi:alkylation response protein AidB-like acyl-CoA dehydrogenase
VKLFIKYEVLPQVKELDHNDLYPFLLIERMKELGLFGINIPLKYGGC